MTGAERAGWRTVWWGQWHAAKMARQEAEESSNWWPSSSCNSVVYKCPFVNELCHEPEERKGWMEQSSHMGDKASRANLV